MIVDLRSDTVTKPSLGMRRAMAEADVGDDVYGEDPTARALESHVAGLLAKEAAVFVPTGTMANQIAILLHCRAGDEVIVGEGAHTMIYESGAAAAWAGVQFLVAGRGGLFTADDLDATWHAPAFHVPRPKLVSLENTHNRGGGLVFPHDDVLRIAELARSRALGLHLDGARLWNAAVATGTSLAELARPFDTVSVCCSKGLGAPAGSLLVLPRALEADARRFRKMLGGGMRQVGVLAAAARYALDHNVARLQEDHAHAKRLAEGIVALSAFRCDLTAVQTNIVMFDVVSGDAEPVVAALRERGVLVSAVSRGRIRAVTHLDVTKQGVEIALDALRAIS